MSSWANNPALTADATPDALERINELNIEVSL